jgi:hypothetical protein
MARATLGDREVYVDDILKKGWPTHRDVPEVRIVIPMEGTLRVETDAQESDEEALVRWIYADPERLELVAARERDRAST